MATTFSWRFNITCNNPAAVSEQVDAIMEQLVLRENANLRDSAIALDLEDMTLDVSVEVLDADVDGAIAQGMIAVRSAIEAAGGCTDNAAERPEGSKNKITYVHAQLLAV